MSGFESENHDPPGRYVMMYAPSSEKKAAKRNL
jgi:hypothetical protein